MKYSVLINSCDSYDDLWIPFIKLFKKYWNFNNCNVYLNTEHKKFSDDVLIIKVLNQINNSELQWGERFLNCLKRIEDDYVVILLDDFFIRKIVDVNKIEKCIDYLEYNKDIACFYFTDTGKLFRNQFIDDCKFNGFELAKKNANYRLNLQASVWRKDDLISFVHTFDTPWSWEMLGTKYLNTEKKFYYLKPDEPRIIDYGYNPLGMGVFRGKWVETDVVPLFNKENIKVNFSKRGFYKAEKNKFIKLKNRIKLRLQLILVENKYYK